MRYDVDSLVDVAVRVFIERGYDGTSIDHIAAAAGLSKSSIYHHVASKEELLSRAIGRALDALFGVLSEPLSKDGEAVNRLRHILRRTTEITVERLPEVALLLRIRGNSETEQRALERRRRFDKTLASIIKKAIDEGAISSTVDPGVIARLIFGMSNSITEWYHPGGKITAQKLADAIDEIVFQGMLR